MRGSSIEFFADQEDHATMFSHVDSLGILCYTSTLSEVNKDNVQYSSALGMLRYLVTHEDPVQNKVFMITLPETLLIKREILMSDGSGVKQILSQLLNPDAAEILLGGEAAPATIVSTTIRTTGETPVAKEIFKRLKKVVSSHAKRVDAHYYVAPNALSKHAAGWRLTHGIECPEKGDLKVA